jgi:hypothetical protein
MKRLSFFSRSLGLAILLMTSMVVHAQLPDGSCIFPEDVGGPSNCPTDINQDGLIAIGDLLIVLGDFGNPCTD